MEKARERSKEPKPKGSTEEKTAEETKEKALDPSLSINVLVNLALPGHLSTLVTFWGGLFWEDEVRHGESGSGKRNWGARDLNPRDSFR